MIISRTFNDRYTELVEKYRNVKIYPPLFLSVQGTERSMTKDIAHTITTDVANGTVAVLVDEPRTAAMRGRGDGWKQQLEIGKNISNALTRNTGDYLCVEPVPEQATLDLVKDMVSGKRDGSATAVLEDDKTIRGCYNVGTHDSSISEMVIQHEDNPALTVTSAHAPKVYGLSTAYRIRKLTEREAFRLMDVSEEDIDKIQAAGISKTQQYKMAGNSIVVSCLYHIFDKMFVHTDEERKAGTQLSLF